MPGVLPDPPQAAALLRWYDRHRRTMPWRALPGQAADPYRVWLSEIMLQQTTVAAVSPYFNRFLATFPTIDALAAAPVDQVMAAWAGLGYYARARNLHACAKAVSATGDFPRDLAGLRALPGIGSYTAAALGSIAFGIPVVPVDGNVERVAARVFAITAELPRGRPIIDRAAAHLGAQDAARARPADFTQALFDLGATICTPAKPACALCPWRGSCAGQAAGIADSLPRKAAKPPRPIRYGAHFWLQDAQGQVLLRRRPPAGLFGGMTELPGTNWRDTAWMADEAIAIAPAAADWHAIGTVRHGLTHFELVIDLYAATIDAIAPGVITSDAEFICTTKDLGRQAIPTVMRRCVSLGLRTAS